MRPSAPMSDAMPLNLPDPVVQALRGHYLAGVTNAQAGFACFRSSEDALTGALECRSVCATF